MAITVEARTSIIKLVVGMFGAAPGANVLSDLVAAYESGMTLNSMADFLAGTDQFKSIYPTFLTNTEFATKLVDNMLGSEVGATDKANAVIEVAALLNAGQSRGQVFVAAINAVDAITSANTVFANAGLAFDNKVEVAVYYSVEKQLSGSSLADLQRVISAVTSSAASVTAAKATADNTETAGGTFTLSANADVLGPNSLTATTKTTAGNDTIYANASGAFSAADIVDGGAGTDTLYSVQDTTVATTLTPILTGVEKVFIDINDGTAGTAHTFTFNGSTSTGLSEVWVNAYSGSTTGTEDTFAITSVAKTVTTGIKGGDGEYHVTTTYSSTAGSADAASLALDSASVDTVTLAGLETINVTTMTGSSTIATLTAAALGTLNVSGDKNLTITNNVDFKDATDTLAFDGTVNASSLSGTFTALLGTGGDNVKFTGGSGKNTVTTGAGNDDLTGGAAADTFTISTGNDKVTGGAGDDRVVVTAAALDGSDTIDLGEGTRDTLVLDVTTLNAAGVDATKLGQVNKLGGIEVIATNGALTAIDASYFTQTVYEATAALTAAVTMSNVAGDTLVISSTGIDLGAGGTAGDALTVSGALPNQSVTLELKASGAASLIGDNGTAGNTALTVASGISTVNIVSTTSSLAPSLITNQINTEAAATATHTIDNVSAGSFVLTGNTSLTIGGGLTAGFTKAVDFNATAFTGKLSIVGSTDADIIKGGSGVDTINGDDGADILTGGAGADTFVFLSTETGNAAPSSTNFETITDFAKSVDIIDWDQALTLDAAAAAATSTVAQVSATGIATFHADDDTLAERVVAAAKGFDADGDFAIFEFGSDSYVLISGDANGTLDAADSLIKLTGVTGLTGATVDGNGNVLIA